MSKIDVLEIQWMKVIEELESKDQEDPELVTFLDNVSKIKPDVKKAMLEYYIRRCNHKYGIAFFQWRIK